MRNYRTALVTGATGGIGEELCRELARRGYTLIITARSEQKLEEQARRLRRTYGVGVQTIAADLADPEAPQRIYTQLGEEGMVVDLLVNNAGFGIGGRFARNSPELLEKLINVNIGAPTRFCRLFLPEMIARREGRILNVASTGSFVPGPNNAAYCASKAYVLSLSEALSEEARGTGVQVTAVCPGATHTGFARTARMEKTLLFNLMVLHAKQVAWEACQALLCGKRVHIVGVQNRMMIAATRLLPRTLVTKASGLMQKPFGARDLL